MNKDNNKFSFILSTIFCTIVIVGLSFAFSSSFSFYSSSSILSYPSSSILSYPSTSNSQTTFYNIPQLAFAQSSVATVANLVSDQNNTLKFNTYENSDIGISIKYPSNFLIDESNSNETVKQVSFFPVEDTQDIYPDTYLSWFDIYVQTFYPPIVDSNDSSLSSDFPFASSSSSSSSSPSSSSSSINISSYLENLANSIQEQDADVTIVEASTKDLLSGYPAYKLITRAYSGNTTIDNIEIGTVVDNKLYALNYEVETSEYENVLPIANKMIYSFKIMPDDSISDKLQLLTNSSELATTVKEKIPIIDDLINTFSAAGNESNSSMPLLDGINTSVLKSLSSIFMDSFSSPSSQESDISNNTSSTPANSSAVVDTDSLNLQSLCNNPLFAELCKGNTIFRSSNDSANTMLNLDNGSISALGSLFDTSNNSSNGINLSEINQLLGPFRITP